MGCGSGGTGIEEAGELGLSVTDSNLQVEAETSVALGEDDNSAEPNTGGPANTDQVTALPQNEIDTSVVSNDVPDSVNTAPTGQAPVIQNTTRVTFDITVPSYQSNELSVGLVWGELSLTAMWVGDEYWTASADFPIQTEENLTVTFYDRYGDMELASFSQELSTGSNDAESFVVLADQFEANQFDEDDDGVSNLDELLAGTDPQINEASLLEIRDFVTLPSDIMSQSQQLEAQLSDERPYTENFSQFIPISDSDDSAGTTVNRNINIDSEGNGDVSFSSWAPWDRSSQSGVRTNNGITIQWEGSLSTYDGDYGRSRNFSNELSVVDATTRDFIQEVDEVYSGFYRDTWDTSSDVRGVLIEGTSLCKPVSGTMSRIRGSTRNSFPFRTTTITVSKEEGDQFWRVVDENEEETIEYFARELRLRYSVADRDYPTFICTSVDL